VVRFIAIFVDLHFNSDTGAINAFMQRTQIARQPIWQHWHYAVRKIGGIATLAGFTI